MCEDTPIHDFSKLKAALENLGYTIGEAKPYTPLEVADVNIANIQSGEIELSDEGIFYINPNTGERHQVFLYKREYDMAKFEKPKFHICNCNAIQQYGRANYRRANTGNVIVYDKSQGRDIEVSGLPLCKYCLSIIRNQRELNYDRDLTSDEFEQILREAGEDTERDIEQDTDMEGYIWKWQKISEAYRTKKNYTCEICGYVPKNRMERQYIHVHHRDGRKTNNRESNLQCLCIACHANINTNHQDNFSKRANKVMLDAFKQKHPNAGHTKDNNTLRSQTTHKIVSEPLDSPDDLPF